ncbi:hypothetical protein [Modestobacter excelsi]|uniref:hypothetical protein n=1 Tax=Modestobacter excelsi TaxID=2213161 RepID=UPI00110CB37E|nr:hypothetical protein [Modestobacter excelsi]
MTALIDSVLDRHRSDYLRDWPVARPQPWPAAPLEQPTDRWMEELVPLLTADGPLFGRLAVIGLCLLEPEVAGVAERWGLVAGLAHEVHPTLTDFLTPVGLRLLRRRAPLAALSLGLLPRAVDLLGLPGEGAAFHLALARQAAEPRGRIGRWAAAFDGGVYVGSGASSRRIVEVPVQGMGWSRGGQLHAGQSLGGLIVYDPASDQLDVDESWPAADCVAVGETALAVGAAAGADAWWGVTDGGAPVRLGERFPFEGGVEAIALGGEQVAVAHHGEVYAGGPTGSGSCWHTHRKARYGSRRPRTTF